MGEYLFSVFGACGETLLKEDKLGYLLTPHANSFSEKARCREFKSKTRASGMGISHLFMEEGDRECNPCLCFAHNDGLRGSFWR